MGMLMELSARASTAQLRDATGGHAANPQRWFCPPCGSVYDPAVGDPEGGVPAGTSFDELPRDWRCPVCASRKCDYVPCERVRITVPLH